LPLDQSERKLTARRWANFRHFKETDVTTLLNDYQKIASEALGLPQEASMTPDGLATLVAASSICKALQNVVDAIDYLSVNVGNIDEQLNALIPYDDDDLGTDDYEVCACVDPCSTGMVNQT